MFFSWLCSFIWCNYYWDNRLYCTKEHWRFSIEIMTQFMPIKDGLCWTEWVFLPNPAVTAQNQKNGLVFGIVAGFEKESRNLSCGVCTDTLIKLFITESPHWIHRVQYEMWQNIVEALVPPTDVCSFIFAPCANANGQILVFRRCCSAEGTLLLTTPSYSHSMLFTFNMYAN